MVDRELIRNAHGKVGWCSHYSKKNVVNIEFTRDDGREVFVVKARECYTCPYCGAKRPANI